MRSGFAGALIIVTLFAGGYFYVLSETICPVPLAYRIGELDERFGLTEFEAQAAVADAAAVWEEATDRELFIYDEEATFLINFIFDERQALADAEGDFKDRLDRAEGLNESLTAQYESLVAKYESLLETYEAGLAAYEADLAAYNAEVTQYNAEGGAPEAAFNRLEATQRALGTEQARLNETADTLNRLVEEINQVSAEGNRVVETYNRGVNVYNQTFGEPREFTQGDYQGDEINIYTFESLEELQLVLVHELGHALSIGHVEGEESIMHYLIGAQPTPLTLADADLAAFSQVCGTGFSSIIERVKVRLGLI